ncbi:hypothetical protein BSKO_05262 [Bryopsis sp. KO-2023]|nr:hypothetical protein BSKO_05262 [Bryopsis sp. KO-2023]
MVLIDSPLRKREDVMESGAACLGSRVDVLLSSATPEETQEHYQKLCGDSFEVRHSTPDEKGKGLFATRDLPGDSVLLHESPLVAIQEVDSRTGAVVCSHCLEHVGGLEYQLSWWLMNMKSEEEDEELGVVQRALMEGFLHFPFAEHLQKSPPVMCSNVCGDIYCSEKCRADAWGEYHQLLCVGPTNSEEETSEIRFEHAQNMIRNGNRGMASIPELCIDQPAMQEFEKFSLQTNGIFLLAARLYAKVLMKSVKILEQNEVHLSAASEQECWEALLEAWVPVKHAWKVIWWEGVAIPEDVTDGEEFRNDLRNLSTHAVQLLQSAIPASEQFPALFHPKVFASVIGMFEQNNLTIDVPSPLELYLDDLDEGEHKTLHSLGIVKDLLSEAAEFPLEGTGYFPITCCINHSCVPNAMAIRRTGEDKDRNVSLISLRNISKGEEICIAYVDIDLELHERETLLRDYGFSCRCDKCTKERKAAVLPKW